MKVTLLFFICTSLLFGCANKPSKVYDYPSTYMIEKENTFDYQPGLECSAFSSSYLLRHYGVDIQGLELFETMPDKLADGTGVYPSGIIKEFEQRGYNAELIKDASIDDLKQEIAKGNPVIVYIHADVDAPSVHYTHYVPIVGYDDTYFYFAESLDYKANAKDEGTYYNRRTDFEEFEKLWTNVDGIYEHPYFQIEKQK